MTITPAMAAIDGYWEMVNALIDAGDWTTFHALIEARKTPPVSETKTILEDLHAPF